MHARDLKPREAEPLQPDYLEREAPVRRADTPVRLLRLLFETCLQLVRLARQIPDIQSSMRAQILLTRSLQPLWEGTVEQRWTEPQLATFQNELTQFNLLADHTNAIRRVVLAHIEMWRAIPNGQRSLPADQDPDNSARQMQPRAWWLDHCIQLYQAGKTAIENVDVAGAQVNLALGWGDLDGLPLEGQTVSLFQEPYWGGAYPGSFVFAQTAVNQAVIACALERFRLAEGRYPKTLDELVPKYLQAIPSDVVRGRPMLYENSGDDRFILRGVGPNQTDDGKKPTSDDWLWSFPTNAPAAVVR